MPTPTPPISPPIPHPARPFPAWKTPLRAIEFALLFITAPAILFLYRAELLQRQVSLMLALLLATAFCLTLLLTDPTFDRRLLWNSAGFNRHWRLSLAIFPLLAAALLALASLWIPDRLFYLVRSTPHIWLLIVLLYPFLSVLPQTIVWRTFVFHRYQHVFPTQPAIILASGLSFAWMHILFQNWIAPIFTLAGGLLFAWTYARSQSTKLSLIEHAVYGLWTFTVGFGWYFYAHAGK